MDYNYNKHFYHLEIPSLVDVVEGVLLDNDLHCDNENEYPDWEHTKPILEALCQDEDWIEEFQEFIDTKFKEAIEREMNKKGFIP
jgi:hypothetical protein